MIPSYILKCICIKYLRTNVGLFGDFNLQYKGKFNNCDYFDVID